MTNDPLLHLRDVVVPVPGPDLPGIERRARDQRRRRAQFRSGIGAAALVAVVAVGGTTLSGGEDPAPGGTVLDLALGAAPARADSGCDPSISTGHAQWVDRTAWAGGGAEDLAALIDDPTLGLTDVGVRTETLSCPPAAPVAVFLAEDPVRGLTIWHDVAAPYAADAEHVSPTTVRGTDALLRDFGGGAFLTWVDQDGVRWLAAGSGMDTGTLIDQVDALALDGGQVLGTPDGFSVVDIVGATRAERTEWWATYGDVDSTRQTVAPDGSIVVTAVPGSGMTLLVSAADSEPAEMVASYWAQGVVVVDIDGRRGVFSAYDAAMPDGGGRLRWQADGMDYLLEGPVGLGDLVTAARGVRPVGLDDPRLAAAGDVDS